jgi:hypothetical protein
MDTWQRPPSPPNDPTLSPEELEEVRSKFQISRLTEAEAPSLASQQFESANENSTDNNVDHLIRARPRIRQLVSPQFHP